MIKAQESIPKKDTIKKEKDIFSSNENGDNTSKIYSQESIEEISSKGI